MIPRLMIPVELTDSRLGDIWTAAEHLRLDVAAHARFPAWRMRKVDKNLEIIQNAVLSLARHEGGSQEAHPVISGDVIR